MGRERELKRQPRDATEARLVAGFVLDSCDGGVLNHEVLALTSRYADDDLRTLGLANIGLRARGHRDAAEAIWTVKIGALPNDRGIVNAEEYEYVGLWARIPEAIVGALCCFTCAGPLREIARFTTQREQWEAVMRSVHIELCLDTVTLEYPATGTFWEIEIETTSEEVLAEFADLLDREFPDVPASKSSKLSHALQGTASLVSYKSRPAQGSELHSLQVQRFRDMLTGVHPFGSPFTSPTTLVGP